MEGFFSTPTDVAVRPYLESRRTRNRVAEADRARLAAWYVQQVESGDRNPARTLAQRYPGTSYKTWANVFSQARTEAPALLTPAPRRGVAGGHLTEHAERLVGAPEIAVDLATTYAETRQVTPGVTRAVGEGRVAAPERSLFDTDAEYDRAWEAWLDTDPDAPVGDPKRYWHMETTDPDEVEDFEDWWQKVASSGG